MKKITTKRLTVLSFLTGMALIAFMVESLFPPLVRPGAKMGISNVFTLLCLVVLTPCDAIVLIIVRTIVGSLFSSGISTLIYSLSAGLVSVLVSAVLMQIFPKISIVSISVVSAVTHNVVQNLIFVWVSGAKLMLGYLPYLALIGAFAGIIVGLVTYFAIKSLPISAFDRLYIGLTD